MASSWRERMVAALIAQLRRGTLTLAQFEQQIDAAVRADEGQAMAMAAKAVAAAENTAQEQRVTAQHAAQRQAAVTSLLALLRRLLGIDATPWAGSAAEVYHETVGLLIDGVWYWEPKPDGPARPWRARVLRVGKRCPYYDIGSFCRNLIRAESDVTDITALGRPLECLAVRPTCGRWDCRLRAGGASEKEIAAETARRYRAAETGSGMIFASGYIVPPMVRAGWPAGSGYNPMNSDRTCSALPPDRLLPTESDNRSG